LSLSKIESVLVTKFPAQLVKELLECYSEQKRNFFLGKHRHTEVEGGRFSEAAFRMLEHAAGFPVTPIGKQLDTEKLINKLPNATGASESVRLHIPRTLRVIYDIRNKRDAAHLADGIDPNLQDSSFVFASLDWVLAEFVRLSGSVTPDVAYALIKSITVNAIPAIENFDGYLKSLKPGIKVSDLVLLLLYHQNNTGATFTELQSWVKPTQRKNLNQALTRMEHDKDLIVLQNSRYKITRLGIEEVQKKKLVEM
jgi:hypothetical protein